MTEAEKIAYRDREAEASSEPSLPSGDLAHRIEAMQQQIASLHESIRTADTALAVARQDIEAIERRVRLDERTFRLRLAEKESATAVLASNGSLMAEELRRTYSRPWRPLVRAGERVILHLALLIPGLLSKRRAERFRRSLAKRQSEHHAHDWDATVMRARGKQPSLLTQRTVRQGAKPAGLTVAQRVYVGLATASAPFSERRSERFRRSAEKRDPYRFRAEMVQIEEQATFLEAMTPGMPVDDAARARRILVADYRLPRPDLSAGDKATFGLIADLRAVGFEVTFLPIDMRDLPHSREALEALGVTVITRNSGYPLGGTYIRKEGARFGVFYFIRVDVAEKLLPSARAVAPDARVIFHAPDLHSLRESRAADVSGIPADRKFAAETQAAETAIMRAADHVVVVSPAEVPFLAEIVPPSRISVFPALYSNVQQSPPGYAARKDIFFLGGFKHPPNVASIKWFVDKVWPAFHAQMPDVEFHIIGAEAPDDVVALGNRPGVRFIGYVRDLDPVLGGYRLSVAPLIYGAGIKGKLGAAMGAGVPSVCTTIGAEGMGVVDGIHALIQDEPSDFAKAISNLYCDPVLWTNIAAKGKQLVEDRFGDAANQASFFRVLEDAGALPTSLYVERCRQATPVPLPDPDPAASVDVSIIIPVNNQWSFTQPCLNSVVRALRGTDIVAEIILADDGSTDETERAASVFPGLRVVRQDVNLGFLGNCNAAAAVARGKSLLFLNNDTVVLPGWLTHLMRVLRDDETAAIVGSKLLYPDGTIQETGGVLYSDASVANLGRGKRRNEPLYCLDREVDYATGASVLVRRSFWQHAGGFDPRFTPAYCEDSDLGMAARARKLRVICAASSLVVHFEHGSYGAQKGAVPRQLASRNAARLSEKWRLQFLSEHLPPSTLPEIAAAHAERAPFPQAAERRKSGKLNVLYFSPFPSHPDNHGNQATIQAFGRRFQRMDHKVHFALLQSNLYDAAGLSAMRQAWDSFDLVPNSQPLGADGHEIPFDGWYEPGLGENIRLLCSKYDIDVVFCSYVFQSKILEYVPAHILKVIDTHDKMGDRYAMLRQNGQKLEFFSCTPEEEGAYLRRADVVVARRAEEAEYFNSVSQRQTAIVIPHFEDPKFATRTFGALRNVGMVASANQINLAITLEFLRAVDDAHDENSVPFQVHIAGQVKDMIPDLRPEDRAFFSRNWVTLHGFVPDIADFYAQVDVVVSPVTMGTGINVKTVQAMAYGMPLLTTRTGGKGIETGEPMHEHNSIRELVTALLQYSAVDSTQLDRLAMVSRDRYLRFLSDANAEMVRMFDMVRQDADVWSTYRPAAHDRLHL